MNRVWQLPLIGLVFLLAACQQQQAAISGFPQFWSKKRRSVRIERFLCA